MIEVIDLIKSGEPVDFATYVAKLGCKPITAMVYISELRVAYNADIETIRDGRKVVSYKLLNPSELMAFVDKLLKNKPIKTKAVAKVAKPVKAAKVQKVAATKTKVATKPKDDEFDVPTLDAEMEIAEISDREFADLREQLGF
jgi:hypothetical protein